MNTIDLLADSWCGRNRPESMNTDWGQSLLAYGLLAANGATGNAAAREYLRRWLTYHLGAGVHVTYFVGSWSPGLLFPQVIHTFPEFRFSLMRLAEEIYEFILRTAIRNGAGIILHNVDLPNIYIDTVYYSVPVLAKLGGVLGRDDWRDDAMHQLHGHLAVLEHPESGFWIHCQENRSGLRSQGAWARGVGWVATTCAELLPCLPKGSAEYRQVAGILRNVLRRLLPLQTSSGLWRTILTDKTSYTETSATAMYLFAMKRARNLRLMPASVLQTPIKRATTGLVKQIDAEGRLLGCSEGTWPGTIEYYKSLSCGEWWWGTGAALLALSEP